MNEVPANIRRAVSRYEPIEAEGAIFYPILLEEYDDFARARPAIEFMQQQIKDVRLMSLPLLQAYYKIDISLARNGQPTTNLFYRALLFLALALRLAPGSEAEKRVQQFCLVSEEKDRDTLKCVRFRTNGDEWHSLTPVQFQRLRPILAAQNGIELESDEANPELVQSKRDVLARNAPPLDAEIEILISSVAALSRTEEAELYSWPILKFNRRAAAYKRIMDYMVYTAAELQGTKWKDGNPFPNPWFDKRRNNLGLISMDEFSKGQDVKTQNGGGFPPIPTQLQNKE